tara:strand:- start:148 stop:483 length:336 start_codon:yes stop_codon:yes gene_type:complete
MKTIFKIPVLLLALMLVVSCGDSKKEKEEEEKLSPVEQAAADGKKLGELVCEIEKVFEEEGGDSEKVKKMMQDWRDVSGKMDDKYAPEGDATDEAKKVFDEARQAVIDTCL